MGMNSITRFLVLGGLVLAVAGCAVRPEPITLTEKEALVARDREALFREQEPVTGPISLAEAMARAIKYNLNHRLRLMEEALAHRQLDLSEISLLPRLAASAGYQDRSNVTSSMGTGVLEASTSTDRSRWDGNLTMTWNILDFGVSWFQAQQDADRALIAAERRRKVIHNLMQEVRFAFWRTAGVQDLETRVGPMIRETEQALGRYDDQVREGLPGRFEAMRAQRELLEILRQLKSVQAELVRARSELAVLLNLEPGAAYRLDAGGREARRTPRVGLELAEMERLALMNLPELWEENYQERIGVAETRKAIARLFPGLEIASGWNYDSNSYLVNQNWWSIAPRLTWNLMNLVSGPSQLRLAEAQEEMIHARGLALAMAALGQVHVAWRNYQAVGEQLELLHRLDGIDHDLLTYARDLWRAEAQGELDRIRAEVRAVATRIQSVQTHAQMQNALGTIFVTLGLDPLPDTVEGHDIATLTRAIEETLHRQEKVLEGGGTDAAGRLLRIGSQLEEPQADRPPLPPREETAPGASGLTLRSPTHFAETWPKESTQPLPQ